MPKPIKPKKSKQRPPMTQTEMAKALEKMQHYPAVIDDLFNENDEDANLSLACTLIAAVGIARNAGADYEKFMTECSQAWENIKDKTPVH